MTETAKDRFFRLQALYRQGRLQEAAKAVTAALTAAPKDPNLLHLAAQIAQTMGDKPRAILLFRRARLAHPGWLEAGYNLALALHANGQTGEAIETMLQVQKAHPSFPKAHVALAQFYQDAGDLPKALERWTLALDAAPDDLQSQAQRLLLRRQLCDWQETKLSPEAVSVQLATVLFDDPALQRQAALRYARQKFAQITPFPAPSWPRHDRLRLGYLSSDFHAHATAYLMAELFELHDRSAFSVYAYSYGIDDRSAIRERIKTHADHFIELNDLTARQAAERIRADEIDVLIDLKGYTRGHRLEIAAYRPARKQAHWLGYPGTLGAWFLDAFVADAVTVPEGQEETFVEPILRLPHCYQINDRQRKSAAPLPRGAYGLPERAFVFASFNQTYKITPEIFTLWCALLKEAPESVLWLYESNPFAPERLKAAAQAQGVDPSRLIFAPPLPLDQHLARYAYVDLALDTHPVGGHTTTSDALWRARPVLTLIGKSFVARVAASLLNAARLNECVCATPQAYLELALALYRDPARLADLKARLERERLTLPLFDTPSFVKNWETALANLAACPN